MRPARFGDGDYGDASRGPRRIHRRIERPGRDRQPRPYAFGREAMIAPGGAATDLHRNETVADAVPPHHLPHDESQRFAADRPVYPHRCERAPETVEMARLLDQRAAPDLANLIDAVAEGEGAVVDRHRGFREMAVSAVDISNAGQAPLLHPRPSRPQPAS